jgi:hypothetical protein
VKALHALHRELDASLMETGPERVPYFFDTVLSSGRRTAAGLDGSGSSGNQVYLMENIRDFLLDGSYEFYNDWDWFYRSRH